MNQSISSSSDGSNGSTIYVGFLSAANGSGNPSGYTVPAGTTLASFLALRRVSPSPNVHIAVDGNSAVPADYVLQDGQVVTVLAAKQAGGSEAFDTLETIIAFTQDYPCILARLERIAALSDAEFERMVSGGGGTPAVCCAPTPDVPTITIYVRRPEATFATPQVIADGTTLGTFVRSIGHANAPVRVASNGGPDRPTLYSYVLRDGDGVSIF